MVLEVARVDADDRERRAQVVGEHGDVAILGLERLAPALELLAATVERHEPPHLAAQQPGRDGLLDEVEGAEREGALHQLLGGGMRGDEHDRRLPRERDGAQPLERGEAVQIGHHHV